MRRLEHALLRFFLSGRAGEGAEPNRQARFCAIAWFWGMPLMAFLSALYLGNGLVAQLVDQLVSIAVGVALLFSWRWGAPIWVLRDGTLGWTAVSFAAASLAQTPAEPSSIFFLTVVPMAATFLQGLARGVRWAVFCALLGIVTVVLGQTGFTWPETDPTPSVTLATNFVFHLVLSLVIARTWSEDREQALRDVQAAARAKSIFLANVSHEIRTPMNGIVGMTEVLLGGQPTEEQRPQLEVIRRSGQSLVYLINDLLDVARLEAGRFEITTAPFSVRALLEDLRLLYAPLAHAKGLSLEVTWGDPVPVRVSGDALRVRQVLSNLLSNAIKFTARGGVTVQVARDEAGLRFTVSDTGPGIEPGLEGRLFQRFEKGSAAGGSGLGLSLSADLVARMGGQLTLARVPVGATFTFALPLPEVLASDPDVAPRLAAPPHGGRVLVVDDNPINLAVASGLLKQAGCEVVTAASGEEAHARAPSAEWSFVLMDLQMPGWNGFETTQRIRALGGALSRVPVIALTASAMPEDVAACLEAGMNEVLTKPLDVRALGAVLERYRPAAP